MKQPESGVSLHPHQECNKLPLEEQHPEKRTARRRRTRVDTAASTVEGDTRDVRVVHHRGVIHVVNFRDVNIVDAAVVIEMIVVPAPAFITAAEVPESVVNSTVKAHRRPPIAFVKNKAAGFPAPPAGRPEKAVAGH